MYTYWLYTCLRSTQNTDGTASASSTTSCSSIEKQCPLLSQTTRLVNFFTILYYGSMTDFLHEKCKQNKLQKLNASSIVTKKLYKFMVTGHFKHSQIVNKIANREMPLLQTAGLCNKGANIPSSDNHKHQLISFSYLQFKGRLLQLPALCWATDSTEQFCQHSCMIKVQVAISFLTTLHWTKIHLFAWLQLVIFDYTFSLNNMIKGDHAYNQSSLLAI